MSQEPPQKTRRPATSWQESLRDVYPYLGLGMQVGLSLVFFVGIGYLLDRWLGTLPWLLLVCALVGMVAVFYQVVRVSKQLGKESRPPDHYRSEKPQK